MLKDHQLYLYLLIDSYIPKEFSLIIKITKTHEIERKLQKEDTSFSKYKELSNSNIII